MTDKSRIMFQDTKTGELVTLDELIQIVNDERDKGEIDASASFSDVVACNFNKVEMKGDRHDKR